MIYKTYSNFSLDDFFESYIDSAKNFNDGIFNFPEEDIQVITNGLKGEATAKNAVSIYRELLGALRSAKWLLPSSKILDYGCGWGRLTRLMAHSFEDANIFGVDVDDRLIASARVNLPHMNFSQIESMGELPFKDSFFDLAFANSVFSHLSEISASYTLNELIRVISPLGIIVISVLEQPELEKFYSNPKQTDWITKIMGDLGVARSTLLKNGFVWGDTHRWDNYGIAVMNDQWLTSKLSAMNAELLGSFRTNENGSQNYKIIKKKA